MVRRALQAVIPVVLVVAACASPRLSLRPEPRAFTADDYESVYDRWTKSADEFALGKMTNVLHATATFEAWEFRWAYVVRYAHDFHLEQDTRTEMLRASLADAQRNHRFFVTLAGRDFRESDLTHERTAWRVLLVDEQGRQTVPVEIERIRKPTPAERTYFSSVSSFRQAFRVVFPVRRADGTAIIPPESRHVTLRLTGALGTVDLRWDLDASPS